jgi:guanylate kinase
MSPTLMVVGPSQVGKNTAIKELVERYNYRFVITCTTRPPRPGEVDGRDYDFLTSETFQRLICAHEFLDWDYFMGNYGGIYNESFMETSDKPKVLHVLARMAIRIQQRYPKVKSVFLEPDDLTMVYSRIRNVYTDPLIVNARYAHVQEEMLHSKMFENIVSVTASKATSEVAAEMNACLRSGGVLKH